MQESRDSSAEDGDEDDASGGSGLFSVPPILYLKGLWAARGLVVFIVIACVMVGAVYGLTKPRLYSASATIGPPSESATPQGGISSALSAAGLAGAFGGNASTFTKYIQLLQSRRLAETLEARQGVLRHLDANMWDEKTHSWIRPSGPIASLKGTIKSAMGQEWSPPSADDLTDELSKMVSVASASSTSMLEITALKNQITTVTVTYKDRAYAIALLGYILEDADAVAREDRLTNAANRIAYLASLSKTTTDVNLSGSLSQLLLDQERTLMILKADEHYSYDMIDPPHANSRPIGSSFTIVVLEFLVLGAGLSAVLVYVVLHRRLGRSAETGIPPLEEPILNPVSAAVRWIGRLLRGRSGRDRELYVGKPEPR